MLAEANINKDIFIYIKVFNINMDFKNLTEEKDSDLYNTINHLNNRQHFLLRGFENKNINPTALNEFKMSYQRELYLIEDRQRLIIQEMLRRSYKSLKETTVKAKKEIKIDGDLKREIANFIIKILSPLLDEKELRGVFRQGYKMMR